MRIDLQCADDAVAQQRLSLARGGAVEQQRRHAAPEQQLGVASQRAQLDVARGHVDRAGPPIRHGDACVGRHAGNEVVEHLEAANRQIEQRTVVAGFDIGRQHAGDGCPLVEARFLHRRADEQRPIVPRNEIAAAAPGDAAKRRAGPRERQQLAAHGAHRHRRRDAVDGHVARPAAGGQHDGVAGQRSAIGVDEYVATTSRDATNAAAFDELRAVAPRRGGERARQVDRADEAVRFDQQAADGAVAELRFLAANGLRIQQERRHAAALEHASRRAKRLHLRVVDRDIERAGAVIGDANAALRRNALDERVEQREAADREIEERAALVRLDVRREDPGRGLRRAHPDGALVDDLDRGPAARQLVRDRAADDSGADHDDVGGAAHESQLSWGSLSSQQGERVIGPCAVAERRAHRIRSFNQFEESKPRSLSRPSLRP